MSTEERKVPELRFKGFSDDWEQRKLGEISSIYDGTHQTPKYAKEGVKFLSVENIKTLETNKYISEFNFKNEYKIHPKFVDVHMTRIGSVGITMLVNSKYPLAYYVNLELIKPNQS